MEPISFDYHVSVVMMMVGVAAAVVWANNYSPLHSAKP